MAPDQAIVSVEQALRALDNMDDYARMSVPIEPIGSYAVLKRFIEQAPSEANPSFPIPTQMFVGPALSEAQAMERDAMRYRWLRDQAHPDREDTGLCCSEEDFNSGGKPFTKHFSGEALDAAIDAAMEGA